MNFGEALEALRGHARVTRSGWNGRGMYIFLVGTWTTGAVAAPCDATRAPFIAMKTASGDIVPWLASQTDLLADDWSEV